jgi:methionyl aminopeptidase
MLDDDWTVVTDDGGWASHWEHTITVTRDGLWVLTAEDGGEQMLESLDVAFGPLAD